LVSAVPEPSFEDLHAGHARRIERLCRLLLNDPTEAQDVTQEVLIKLWNAQRAGQTPEAWERWLTRVTVNACRDRRRSGWWRRWRDPRPDPTEQDLSPVVWTTPEDTVIGRETGRAIWSAYRQLSVRQREVFALRYVHELSTSEAAETLGMSEGTAKQHLFRAVRHLRKALRGES
jgi:RNA polymerase sigma-70 factor (ECF subfamily)